MSICNNSFPSFDQQFTKITTYVNDTDVYLQAAHDSLNDIDPEVNVHPMSKDFTTENFKSFKMFKILLPRYILIFVV